MASMSQQVQLLTTVTQVEAMAAKKAAEFALEVVFNKVVLEGDSKIVYKDLKNNGPLLALHGHPIQDVKAMIPLFSSICFSHVGRLGNKVAHSLARRAILSQNLNVWMEDVPPDILDVVQADFQPSLIFNTSVRFILKKKKKKKKVNRIPPIVLFTL